MRAGLLRAVIGLLILTAPLRAWAGEAMPGPALALAPGLVGKPAADALVIADHGATAATVVVAAEAGKEERAAAADLVKYIEMMSGARPALADTEAAIRDALTKERDPLLIVGALALDAEPELGRALERIAKKEPTLRADAIAIRRRGNRVYLAGTNDEAHYYAVAKLLRDWGCRWFMPSAFGESIPDQPVLTIGDIDYAYGSPFEVRGYWVAWNGEQADRKPFSLRNMMNDVRVPAAHALGKYTKALVPAGKSRFAIPIAEDLTADVIATHPEVDRLFSEGRDFSLGMEDGLYTTSSPLDVELQGRLFDKYFLSPSYADNFLALYNKIADRLLERHPDSRSRIGFLAYSNMTIPPQRKIVAAKPLVASLAPIDIDPSHGMDDPRSPQKREFGAMMRRWAEIMQGRVWIRDYDQGMLVWRDIPNPITPWFEQDVRHYRNAGLLGAGTESRNALATVFLNLYVRGQLLWDPDTRIADLLADFYPRFYGSAAEPMAAYWGAIHKAWADTIVTEHEYLVIPAIYTPELIVELRRHLEAAERIMAGVGDKPGERPRDWVKYQERMRFTRLSFDLIESYGLGVRAAASEAEFGRAAALLDKALATRLELGGMNRNFTTRVIPTMPSPETAARGPRWMSGEAEQYRGLAALIDGARGRLVARLPLEWAFRRDPHDTGLAMGFARQTPDLGYWEKARPNLTLLNRKDYPTTEWEMLRTDLYAQAQGILHPDFQSFTGHLWYRTEVDLPADALGDGKPLHVMFPGLLNEAWLYVNGDLVAHRAVPLLWWQSDYKFEWDVDLSGRLAPGRNSLTVRLFNPHHLGGMFRRPFLYAPNPAPPEDPSR